MSDRNHRINHEPVFLLNAVPWRESSLRLEVFSRRYGRVALLARSARKRQSELRGILVPFVPIDASWYGNTELKTLHRAEWLGGWQGPLQRPVPERTGLETDRARRPASEAIRRAGRSTPGNLHPKQPRCRPAPLRMAAAERTGLRPRLTARCRRSSRRSGKAIPAASRTSPAVAGIGTE